ncbi:alanine racemase [Rhodohalobacter sulfatireducens]|jgi:predicted amino acid racemase|uniref:Alanine/ornithine racemase family PLP-dependent enzyme n=1 Tax=Rhodohalobacter sulfatireducens TaxID=2911366 RepID=A0ABS9KGY7_9BACT|nr:alanine/ornithine racemase family PLP-dependent enzyme [Rhodohalobacter sulfatireducens]MCG2590117.1 alanine/ornithine racemase family PLP-dependent enzyme [Rhodohalobacter sulfatireducens]MDR9365646.1 alanine/ornithine racemase family PLP-dependent enzyme [Balneolaceae bacterium]
MAYLKLYREELRHNFQFLDELFKKNGIKWGITTKLFCGNKAFLNEVIDLGVGEVHDSRVSNLKVIKEIDPDTVTIYIKPPPKDIVRDVVKYADISLNTELATLHDLSEEAERQNKVHKVIIMIEMGDLREGVMRDDLINFYEKVFRLPGIEVVGLGTNLNCLHGVMPDGDKLIQLALYKQIIELRFKKEIPLVSGGTTVTIPLLLKNQLPTGINHFRVGEALFFGKNLFSDGVIEGMSDRVLELFTQIIELSEKPKVPMGELGVNPQGETTEISEEDYGKTSYRAIIDIGVLDIQPNYLIPVDDNITITDASSDMLVLDVGSNPKGYKVGDMIRFKLKYMGALGLMSSDYIEKKVAD